MSDKLRDSGGRMCYSIKFFSSFLRRQKSQAEKRTDVQEKQEEQKARKDAGRNYVSQTSER